MSLFGCDVSGFRWVNMKKTSNLVETHTTSSILTASKATLWRTLFCSALSTFRMDGNRLKHKETKQCHSRIS